MDAEKSKYVFKCHLCAFEVFGKFDVFVQHHNHAHKGSTDDVRKVVRDGQKKFFELGENFVEVVADFGDEARSGVVARENCPFCDFVAPSGKLKLLYKHVHAVHDPVCPSCPAYKIDDIYEFVKHLKSQEHASKRLYSCSSCEHSTINLGAFWAHRKSLHAKAMLKFVCEANETSPNTEIVRANAGTCSVANISNKATRPESDEIPRQSEGNSGDSLSITSHVSPNTNGSGATFSQNDDQATNTPSSNSLTGAAIGTSGDRSGAKDTNKAVGSETIDGCANIAPSNPHPAGIGSSNGTCSDMIGDGANADSTCSNLVDNNAMVVPGFHVSNDSVPHSPSTMALDALQNRLEDVGTMCKAISRSDGAAGPELIGVNTAVMPSFQVTNNSVPCGLVTTTSDVPLNSLEGDFLSAHITADKAISDSVNTSDSGISVETDAVVNRCDEQASPFSIGRGLSHPTPAFGSTVSGEVPVTDMDKRTAEKFAGSSLAETSALLSGTCVTVATSQHASGPNTCIFCQQPFGTLEDLFNHVHRVHDKSCPQCNHVCVGIGGIKAHMSQRHISWDDVGNVRCPKWGCVASVSSLHEYWRHRLERHFGCLRNVLPGLCPSGSVGDALEDRPKAARKVSKHVFSVGWGKAMRDSMLRKHKRQLKKAVECSPDEAATRGNTPPPPKKQFRELELGSYPCSFCHDVFPNVSAWKVHFVDAHC